VPKLASNAPSDTKTRDDQPSVVFSRHDDPAIGLYCNRAAPRTLGNAAVEELKVLLDAVAVEPLAEHRAGVAVDHVEVGSQHEDLAVRLHRHRQRPFALAVQRETAASLCAELGIGRAVGKIAGQRADQAVIDAGRAQHQDLASANGVTYCANSVFGGWRPNRLRRPFEAKWMSVTPPTLLNRKARERLEPPVPVPYRMPVPR
jgi:hypothetical protein